MSSTCDPRVFAVPDIDAAKRIILTHEDSATEDRWARKTPYLADLIEEHLAVNPGTLLLDYGSGIGRIATHTFWGAPARDRGREVIGWPRLLQDTQ